MKKLNGKLVVSAILATAMLSVSSVSAGAIGYSAVGTPGTGTPSTEKTSDTAGSTTDTAAEVLTEKAVEDKIAEAAKSGDSEATVYMEEDANGNATVQEAAIAEIAKSDVVVTIEVESDDGPDYSISIDPALITDAKAINVAMDITVGTKADQVVSDVEIPAGSIIIAPQQKGDFGMTLTVTIPAKELKNVDLNNVSLYYISNSGKVTKVDSQLKINSDGSISVSLTHASAYVISDVDLTEEDGDDISDDDLFNDDDDDDDDGAAFIDDDDDSYADNEQDKSGNTPIVISGDDVDGNPGTGVSLALGAFAASAAAVVVAAKKRK